MTTGINYSEKIPNNVNLSEDRTLQRALEGWQPNFARRYRWTRRAGPSSVT
jgi:benzoyl-CoA 2,3-dioxygenase component B